MKEGLFDNKVKSALGDYKFNSAPDWARFRAKMQSDNQELDLKLVDHAADAQIPFNVEHWNSFKNQYLRRDTRRSWLYGIRTFELLLLVVLLVGAFQFKSTLTEPSEPDNSIKTESVKHIVHTQLPQLNTTDSQITEVEPTHSSNIQIQTNTIKTSQLSETRASHIVAYSKTMQSDIIVEDRVNNIIPVKTLDVINAVSSIPSIINQIEHAQVIPLITNQAASTEQQINTTSWTPSIRMGYGNGTALFSVSSIDALAIDSYEIKADAYNLNLALELKKNSKAIYTGLEFLSTELDYDNSIVEEFENPRELRQWTINDTRQNYISVNLGYAQYLKLSDKFQLRAHLGGQVAGLLYESTHYTDEIKTELPPVPVGPGNPDVKSPFLSSIDYRSGIITGNGSRDNYSFAIQTGIGINYHLGERIGLNLSYDYSRNMSTSNSGLLKLKSSGNMSIGLQAYF